MPIITGAKEMMYEAIIIKITDLKKTFFLKTAIIEKEWIIKLNKDIFDGPKYLEPLMELIEFNSWIWYFNVPEKLLHKLSFIEIF